jgi:hypothetical protein
VAALVEVAEEEAVPQAPAATAIKISREVMVVLDS